MLTENPKRDRLPRAVFLIPFSGSQDDIMNFWDLLLQIILLLLACLVAGAIMAWLKQSPLVGYLLAGMVMGGPGSFSIVKADDQIEAIAELGVALLLFSLGLEFSWRRVLGLGTKTLLCGVIQVFATLLAGAAGSLLFGINLAAAIAIGAMLSLSSTAAVLRVLADLGETDSTVGRNSLAVLLVQDMAVVPLAILIPLLADGGEFSAIAARIATIAITGAGLVAGLWFLLNFVAVRALRSSSFGRNRELTVLLSIIVGLGATWAAHAAKLSPALGAFVAGMFLGNSPFAVQIRADVASLRIVLLTLFFGAVGMIADPVWMLSNLPLVLCVAAIILLLKATVIWIIFWLSGQPSGSSMATGLCLCQVGEFAFVLGGEARSGGLLTDRIYSAIVSASIATLLVTPWLISIAPKAAAWMNRRRGVYVPESDSTAYHADSTEVLIVGFGPAGRGAVDGIHENQGRVLIVDLNVEAIATAESQGFRGVIADATNAETLEHLHLNHLKTVVITLPSRQDALTVLQLIRKVAPQATRIVRTRYKLHHDEFLSAGADVVIGDEEHVAKALAAAVLKHQKRP